MHYARWYAHGDPYMVNRRRKIYPPCKAEGCEKTSTPGNRGFCIAHYQRLRRYGDPLGRAPAREQSYLRRKDPNGYVVLYWPGHPNASVSNQVAEHVAMMVQELGRPLNNGEIVHHINGIKDDNRPENLELWTRAHPCGQRVTDLLAWAHELIEQYRDTPQLWPEHLQP